ncbi:MAG: AzlD domain-containing protein [Eubacteriales bacterium]|nr:AzlD domain-containing protein [Eubacteriales bacterium]
MGIDVTRSILIILICGICTYLERALPFVVFHGREVPAAVRYLGKVLPMAIMATLVIYCIKDISFTAPGTCLPYLIGIAVTALVHLWKRNNLLSIALGTAVYMVMVQLIFV